MIEGVGAGRTGGHQLEDRELSRLSDRHLGPGAGRPRAGPGAEVRRAARDLARRRRPRLRRARPTARLDDGASVRRARSSSPPARATASSTCRTTSGSKARHPLRGDRDGGAALRGEEVDRGRRRQFGGPGRDVPVAHGAPCAHARARRRPRRDDVATISSSGSTLAADHAPHRAPRSPRSRATSACASVTWIEPRDRRERDARRSATSS